MILIWTFGTNSRKTESMQVVNGEARRDVEHDVCGEVLELGELVVYRWVCAATFGVGRL